MLTDDLITRRIRESIKVKEGLLQHGKTIKDISQVILNAYRIEVRRRLSCLVTVGVLQMLNTLLLSFLGRFYLDRPSLPAIALTVNTSFLTAIGNDYSFSEIFSKQLEGLGNKDDIAVGISAGGNSENVIKALKLAKRKGIVTIGLTGRSGGKMKEVVDLCLCVCSDNTPRIQEAHITAGHIICEIVEKELFDHEEK